MLQLEPAGWPCPCNPGSGVRRQAAQAPLIPAGGAGRGNHLWLVHTIASSDESWTAAGARGQDQGGGGRAPPGVSPGWEGRQSGPLPQGKLAPGPELQRSENTAEDTSQPQESPHRSQKERIQFQLVPTASSTSVLENLGRAGLEGCHRNSTTRKTRGQGGDPRAGLGGWGDGCLTDR